MPRRLLLTIAALSLAALAGVSGCADQVSPAARVGDTTVSHADLMTEVEEWAGNDATQAAVDLPQGAHRFAMASVSGILSERILLEMVANEFDRLDLEVTDDDRSAVLGVLGIDPSQEEALLGGFSDEYREHYLDAYAKGVAVQTELGDDDFVAFLHDAAQDVEVSSRYGTWNASSFQVVPPTAPAADTET